MEFTPIKTRVLLPPKDDLFAVLDEYLTGVRERDVLVITSKVVSIHEGRCVPLEEADIDFLTRQEAEHYLLNEGKSKSLPLTIKHKTLLYRGGVDSGNSGEYYTLLPENPDTSASRIRDHAMQKHGINKLGVVITDSTVLPFKSGVTSISIGSAGFQKAHVHSDDQRDLFGVPVPKTSTNIADSIASGSALVTGEADESTPIVIARNIPRIIFSDEINDESSKIDQKRDLYYPLLKPFFTKDS